jgi:hypothetical protein
MSIAKTLRKWLGAAFLELLGAAVAGAFFIPLDWGQWTVYVRVGASLVLLAFAATAVREGLRKDRRLKTARAGGGWPLGEPYFLEVDTDGVRRGARLELGESTLAIEGASEPWSDVLAIRVRPVWIEIETKRRRVRVVPSSYAERERLLWELAYRRADAFEFAAEKPAGAAPASTAADEDVADLDRRMTGSGLGSALAGPMDGGNPAPPRKSGLGVGLFAPPPGGPRESSM